MAESRSRAAMLESVGVMGGEGAPFVGRERELDELWQRLSLARTGRGGIALVSGEPGIGKTRLVQALAARAQAHDGAVLWGRCWDPEMGAPAFWPWTEALAARADALDPVALRASLGVNASALAQIVPELRVLLPELPPHEIEEPEEARFRLFGAVTTFLRQLASAIAVANAPLPAGPGSLPPIADDHATPLLVVLDDLHWADRASLLLLQYVARERGPVPFLVVGLYDGTALDPAHPLKSAVASLQREPSVTRVDLRGLDGREVRALVEARLGPQRAVLAYPLAHVLHQETEGNPFFVTETLDHLLQDAQALVQQWPAVPGRGGLIVPTSVRDVIEQRVARLSDDAREVLSTAAVIGRDFDPSILATAVALDPARLDAALSEAETGGVIVSTGSGERFRFGHALVRKALYDAMPSRARLRLHRLIAQEIEARTGGDRHEHAGELAYHFGQIGEVEKTRRYSRLAGERAEQATAWEEASRQYELCLALTERDGDGGGMEAADLLVALGRCSRNANDQRAAWRCFMGAIARYEAAGDGVRVARATLEALRIAAPPERRESLVRRALVALGESDAGLAAHLELHRSLWTRSEAGAAASRRRAAELAERHGLAEVAPILAQADASRALIEGRPEAARRIFEEMYESCVALGNGGWALGFLIGASAIPLFAGALDHGEERVRRAARAAGERHNRLREAGLLTWLAGAAFARGDRTRHAALLDRATELHPANFSIDAARALSYEVAGELERALSLAPGPERTGGYPGWLAVVHGARARVRFHAGDLDGARDDLARWGEQRSPFRLADGTPSYLHTLTCVDEVLPALGDEALVEEVYTELGQWSWARFAPANACAIDQMRGALALRLGRLDAAEAHYREGLAWAERERCPVEAGRCLLGLAELAARRADEATGQALLQRARALFQEAGALLYLRQADAKAEEFARHLTTAPEPEPPSATAHLSDLSEREIEVLRLICAGRTNRQIAALLSISSNTVARHVTHIFTKTGTANRAEAVSYALRSGLVAIRGD